MSDNLQAIKYTQYVTSDNDTWYNIAYKAYGDASKYAPIIAANFGVPVSPFLPSGLRLLIPVIKPDLATTDKSLLPPWKRGTTTGEAEAKASVPLFLQISSKPGGSFDGSFD